MHHQVAESTFTCPRFNLTKGSQREGHGVGSGQFVSGQIVEVEGLTSRAKLRVMMGRIALMEDFWKVHCLLDSCGKFGQIDSVKV